jgi:hypothetical protein
MSTGPTRSPIETLLDKQAITEVLYRYCRGCDRGDESALRACFLPDSTHRHGGFEGKSGDFCTLAMKIISAATVSKHLLTNVLIEFDGPELAFSESHYYAYHRQTNRKTGATEDEFSGGRYLDRFERRDGVWKIAERVGLIDWERYEAPAERHIGRLQPAARGQRWPEDELYRRFLPVRRSTP